MRSEYDSKSKDPSSTTIIAIDASGELKCKQVYFRPWTKSPDESTLIASLSDFVAEIIDQMIAFGHRSIAFPAIGCGLLGCSPDTVASGMIKGLQRQEKHAITVTIVIQSGKNQVYDAFDRQIKRLSSIRLEELSLETSLKLKNSIIAIEKCDMRQIEVGK